MPFSGINDEVVYILVSININQGKDMDSVNYYCDALDYKTGTWWICDYGTILEFSGYPDSVYDELLHEDMRKRDF